MTKTNTATIERAIAAGYYIARGALGRSGARLWDVGHAPPVGAPRTIVQGIASKAEARARMVEAFIAAEARS